MAAECKEQDKNHEVDQPSDLSVGKGGIPHWTGVDMRRLRKYVASVRAEDDTIASDSEYVSAPGDFAVARGERFVPQNVGRCQDFVTHSGKTEAARNYFGGSAAASPTKESGDTRDTQRA